MTSKPVRIAAVSFLNTKPLIHYLLDRPDVEVEVDVPSKLIDRLRRGQADAALVRWSTGPNPPTRQPSSQTAASPRTAQP